MLLSCKNTLLPRSKILQLLGRCCFHALFSFPGSAAEKIVSTLSISNGSGTTPYRNRAATSNPPGGWFRENLILIFQCWFSRRISLPPQNHGGNGRKRRTRRKLENKNPQVPSRPCGFINHMDSNNSQQIVRLYHGFCWIIEIFFQIVMHCCNLHFSLSKCNLCLF